MSVGRRAYPLGSPGEDEQTAALLRMIAGDRGVTPWVNVKCRGHDSGSQLRLQEDGDGWGVTFRAGSGHDVEFGNGKVAEAVTVRCETCGQPTRRTIQSVLPETLRSLVGWTRGGRRHRPAVSWTTT